MHIFNTCDKPYEIVLQGVKKQWTKETKATETMVTPYEGYISEHLYIPAIPGLRETK